MKRVPTPKLRAALKDEHEATAEYASHSKRSTGKAKRTFKGMSREEAGHAKNLTRMLKGRKK